MKKNLINEINEMKRLFGHQRGVVISEQPDVMEPDTETETRPKTRPGKPDSDPFPNPFNPDRSKEFNPLPDLEPQGEFDDEFEFDFDMNEPDVMEPDTETETRPKTRPGRPDSDPFPNPFNPDRAKEFNPLPDLEPQGRLGDDENEPFIDDVDTDYSESRSLEDLVAKYLNRRNNN
jgi:hypothetical protein